jgi:hypothetical protein
MLCLDIDWALLTVVASDPWRGILCGKDNNVELCFPLWLIEIGALFTLHFGRLSWYPRAICAHGSTVVVINPSFVVYDEVRFNGSCCDI